VSSLEPLAVKGEMHFLMSFIDDISLFLYASNKILLAVNIIVPILMVATTAHVKVDTHLQLLR